MLASSRSGSSISSIDPHLALAPPPASSPRLIEDLRGRMERRLDLVGEEFGALIVLRYVRTRSNGHAVWRARCRPEMGGCGEEVERPHFELRDAEDCGCRGRAIGALTADGLSLTMAGWERELLRRGARLSRETIRRRLRAGWTPADAIFTPAAGAR